VCCFSGVWPGEVQAQIFGGLLAAFSSDAGSVITLTGCGMFGGEWILAALLGGRRGSVCLESKGA
jgi:hypothetical protein